MSDKTKKPDAESPKSVEVTAAAKSPEPSFEERLKPILEPLQKTVATLAETVKDLAGKQADFARVADDFSCREESRRDELATQLIACKLYEEKAKEDLLKRSIESLEREVRAAQHGVTATGFPRPISTLNGGPRQATDEDANIKTMPAPKSFSSMFKKKQAEQQKKQQAAEGGS